MTEAEPDLNQNLVGNWLYGTLFRFYLRNIATVFIPFFLLAYLNICIVTTLRRQQRSAAMFRIGASEHKVFLFIQHLKIDHFYGTSIGFFFEIPISKFPKFRL